MVSNAWNLMIIEHHCGHEQGFMDSIPFYYQVKREHRSESTNTRFLLNLVIAELDKNHKTMILFSKLNIWVFISAFDEAQPIG